MKERSPINPSVLVIDDDPMFGAVIGKYARQHGIPITLCTSVNELRAALKRGHYDVAIVDYYLGSHRGTEVASLFGTTTPVILVSHSAKWMRDGEPWPSVVTKFVHKNNGAGAIIEAGIAAASLDRDLDSADKRTKQRSYF